MISAKEIACPTCDSTAATRIGRKGFWQRIVLASFGIYPWKCGACGVTFLFRNRGYRGLPPGQVRSEDAAGGWRRQPAREAFRPGAAAAAAPTAAADGSAGGAGHPAWAGPWGAASRALRIQAADRRVRRTAGWRAARGAR